MRLTSFLSLRRQEEPTGTGEQRSRAVTVSMWSGAAVCVAGALLLSGCGKFFPPLTTGGGGTGGGDYIYAGNFGTNPLSVAGFSLANSALSVISGSPWSVTGEPTALAITPNDDYLYMGSASGGIYVYTISSTGAITLGNGGAAVATGVEPSVLRVDPTGEWLIGGDAFAGEAYVFQIGSGGVLTSISSSVVTLNAADPATDVEITPGDATVFVSCGTGGIYTLSFDSSTGAMAQINSVLAPKQTGGADYGMAITPSGGFLLAAETGAGAVRVFTINATDSTLAEVTGSPYTTASGARAVLVDASGSYVYVANRTQGTVSAFSISTTGTLTAIAGSPFTTGGLPEGLVEDNSGTYVAVVCAGGTPDVQVFTISTTTPGALTSFETATTGTDPTEASTIVATH